MSLSSALWEVISTLGLEGRMRHILPMAVFLQVALWLVRSWPCCLLSLHCLLLVLSVCAVLFISDMLFVTPHFCQELCHIHMPSLCFNKHRLRWGLNSLNSSQFDYRPVGTQKNPTLSTVIYNFVHDIRLPRVLHCSLGRLMAFHVFS